MNINIPNWFEKINTFLYFCIASLVMIVFSMAYGNEKYINLWLFSYLYGFVMYVVTVIDRGKESAMRKWELGVSILLYIIIFIYLWIFVIGL